MKIYVEKKYFIIPLLYICVIGFFLYLHFSGNQLFTEEYGRITFSWTASSAGRGKGGISSAVISCAGIQFAFDEEQGITAATSDNTTRTLSLNEYNLEENGFALSFEEAVTLRFSAAGETNRRISIITEKAAGADAIQSIRLPFTVAAGNSIEQPSNLPLLIINHAQNGKSFLSLSHNSAIETETPQLILNRENDHFSYIIIEQPQNSEVNPYAYWFARENSFEATAEAYRSELNSFIDKAYTGWRERYDAEQGGWTIGNGTVRFQEYTAAAYLSEALSRNEYDTALNLIRESLNRNQQQLTVLTAPFLGNLLRHVSAMQQQDTREIQTIESLLREEDPQLITRDHLLRFIVNRGPFSLVQEVLRFTEALDPSTLTASECAGLIKMYNQQIEGIPESNQILEPLASSAQEKLLTQVERREQGLFILGTEGSPDLQLSIEAGKQLLVKGTKDDQSLIMLIGQELLRSSLALADENGIVRGFDQIILPEDLYPLLVENSFYPHEISLYEEFGPGSWIWTIADFSTIDAQPEELTLSFIFPEEQTHHMIIQGIEPFTQLQMRGIPWRSDPAFERYPLGWIYNQNSEILSVKATHQTEEETILITY